MGGGSGQKHTFYALRKSDRSSEVSDTDEDEDLPENEDDKKKKTASKPKEKKKKKEKKEKKKTPKSDEKEKSKKKRKHSSDSSEKRKEKKQKKEKKKEEAKKPEKKKKKEDTKKPESEEKKFLSLPRVPPPGEWKELGVALAITHKEWRPLVQELVKFVYPVDTHIGYQCSKQFEGKKKEKNEDGIEKTCLIGHRDDNHAGPQCGSTGPCITCGVIQQLHCHELTLWHEVFIPQRFPLDIQKELKDVLNTGTNSTLVDALRLYFTNVFGIPGDHNLLLPGSLASVISSGFYAWYEHVPVGTDYSHWNPIPLPRRTSACPTVIKNFNHKTGKFTDKGTGRLCATMTCVNCEGAHYMGEHDGDRAYVEKTIRDDPNALVASFEKTTRNLLRRENKTKSRPKKKKEEKWTNKNSGGFISNACPP